MIENNNMRNFLLIGLYFVLSLQEVFAERENEIKRGIFSFMAIVYYPDERILDSSGARFSRSAVLIKPEWLISSSMETNDTQLAFPRKTLLARAGAIAIDANFTFNEDEDEQEQEIIQMVRPTNFSVSQWWYEDITLLKTLHPFNMTSAVGFTTPFVKQDYLDKICHILVYTKKYANSTDEKLLMQLPVELLPSSIDNCGTNFRKDTMICASDSDEMKNILYDPDFCEGNGGGPLICEEDVIGLQTYENNNCKQPHLYQLISSWDDFISCGVEEKCQIQLCAGVCESIDKDVRVTKKISLSTTEHSKEIVTDQSAEETNDEDHLILSDTTKQKAMITITTVSGKPPSTMTPTTEYTSRAETPSTTITESDEATTKGNVDLESSSSPNEKNIDHRKKLDHADDSENTERKTNVEAQRHEVKKKVRNAAHNCRDCIVYLFYSLSFGILSLSCLN